MIIKAIELLLTHSKSLKVPYTDLLFITGMISLFISSVCLSGFKYEPFFLFSHTHLSRFVQRDPVIVCADSVFWKQPPKTTLLHPHSSLLSTCGVRKKHCLPSFLAITGWRGGGGGVGSSLPHKSFPIPGQTEKEARRLGVWWARGRRQGVGQKGGGVVWTHSSAV